MNLNEATDTLKDLTIVILAGGAGRRMEGRDKGLEIWRGKPLIEHIIERVTVKDAELLISCNRNLDEYQRYGPVVADSFENYQGPLAGIAAAMDMCLSNLVLVLPCDCPTPPPELYPRLREHLEENNLDVAYAWDGERDQYLFALMKRELKVSLQEYLQSGHRSVHRWYASLRCDAVSFVDQAAAFQNINNLADLDQ